MTENRTKIIATLGPASTSEKVLLEIINAGVNVCRINFSHGTHEEYAESVKLIREINKTHNKNVAILGDLQGPKIRIGLLEQESIELLVGQEISITTEEVAGNIKQLSVNYADFTKDVKKGEKILIDDGKIELEVLKKEGTNKVVCKINVGGILTQKKGVNLPNTILSVPSLTKKDKKDLKFILDQKLE